jgi:hypothetical protein
MTDEGFFSLIPCLPAGRSLRFEAIEAAPKTAPPASVRSGLIAARMAGA